MMTIKNNILMYRISRILIAIMVGHLWIGSAMAGGCEEIRVDLPESSEMRSAADRCITARKS